MTPTQFSSFGDANGTRQYLSRGPDSPHVTSTHTYLAAVRDVLCRDGGPRLLLLLASGRLYLAAIAFRNLAPGAPQRCSKRRRSSRSGVPNTFSATSI